MALINMTEMIVRPRLLERLEATECCHCERCYLDMLAIVLNNVKPRYVNTHEGELISRANCIVRQNSIDIDISIVKAINIVSRVPHHERPMDL